VISTTNVMATVFWDAKVVNHVDFLGQGLTIHEDFATATLKKI